ncbi:type II toxin-antitoxin system PemK/MazF family toxin [Desulfotruncus alcoholivorax]|uniref:type II toxin-antitoxin system PemK/MazF family toxin n=1 Tax=Desulfotruncus alcoholivorax TaxID=265477 RepID=UPI00146FA256|nr:type II toxin-antitoxin system PemK/MazF family toxin [Desulfotruncus alcoholivorax]
MTNTTKRNGMNYKPGDIVIARISFSEANTGKVKSRPAMVISTKSHNMRRDDLVLLKISSTPVHDNQWEIPIESSDRTGLAKPSKIICDEVRAVYKGDVRFIGRAGQITLTKVKKKLHLLFGI